MPKAISTYTNPEGVLVQVFAYKKPARANRTWKPIKGSLFSTGAKAASLTASGLNVRTHG